MRNPIDNSLCEQAPVNPSSGYAASVRTADGRRRITATISLAIPLPESIIGDQLREEAMDALCDVLFAADSAIELADMDEAPEDVRSLEADLRELYINATQLMGRLRQASSNEVAP